MEEPADSTWRGYSLAERDRRWGAVRANAAREGFDCVFVPLGNGIDARYLTHASLFYDVIYNAAAPLPLVPVDPARIVAGRDGLIVRRGRHVGLLLPQVATEYHWGPEAFLAATCRKAGLPPDAWREPDTEVLTFQADVFGE